MPAGGLPEQLRRVKDDDELKAIAEAAKLADEVYEWTIEQGLGGKTEVEVARAAQARMRELGAEPSFPADRRRGAERRHAARRAGRKGNSRRRHGDLRHGGRS